MKLKQSNSIRGLSDLLNYAHFVDDGILINKDGAFLVAYQFRGPDLYSANSSEVDALTANFNRMLTFLDDGWMIHVDVIRIPAMTYPEQGHFPESTSALIDEERRQCYESFGLHYENMQFLTFVWKFPLTMVKNTRHWFVEGITVDGEENLTTLLKQFNEKIEQCIGIIESQFIYRKLTSSDLLSFINTCISGKLAPIAVPPDGCFIDAVLARHALIGGYIPRIGENYIYVISIIGYLNEETNAGILEKMTDYPLNYRWCNRFIIMSELTAEREIKRYQRNWNNKVKGFSGVLKEAVFGKPAQKVNISALQMSQQIDNALKLNNERNTCFGYWTSEVVLMNENIEELERVSKELTRTLEQAGFTCLREDVNTMDAWLGTIPGHGSCNVRRVFINAINLAHTLPLHSIWVGDETCAKESLLPKGSPPVFYADTMGKIPFRFHLDVADVGHQVVLGPTGSGKTTYLGFLIAQFLRYKNAKIYLFDKDYSHQALTAALDGTYYDFGRNDQMSFCPLADLSTESKKLRAISFIEDLVLLQGVTMTPDIRKAIYNAIECLADDSSIENRTLTIFQAQVQNEEVRSAIHYYTLRGPLKLFDATKDCLQFGYLHCFEMNWLLAQPDVIYLPVLRYLFNQIESRLENAETNEPTLIILEEAWLYISHEVFAKKLKDWLKTLRKKNARVIFATQSLADLYEPSTKSLTSITAAIMESCHTKIYLPNQSMDEEITELYRKMGLQERQLQIISKLSQPKRHYYLVTKEGNRLFDLGLNDGMCITRLFIGLSKEKSLLLLEYKEKYKQEWVYYWLMQHGYKKWAEYWLVKYNNKSLA